MPPRILLLPFQTYILYIFKVCHLQQVREMLQEETGQLRKENNAKDVQLAAAKEAVQAEVKKAASASTKADSLSSDLEKVL